MKYQVVNMDRNLATLRYLDESGQEVVIPVHPLAYLEIEAREILSYPPTLAIVPVEAPPTSLPQSLEPEPPTPPPLESPMEDEPPLSEDSLSTPSTNSSSKRKRSS